MEKRGKLELSVGIFTVLFLAAGLGLLSMLGKFWEDGGNRYYVLFKFLNDLKPTATVRYAGGVMCGRVLSMDVQGHLARVEVELDDAVEVGDDTIFRIQRSGFLGENYLMVENPKPVSRPLPDESEIRGEDPANLDVALKDVSDFVELIRVGLIGPDRRLQDIQDAPLVTILGETTALIQNLNTTIKKKDEELTGAINEVRTLITNGTSFVDNLNGVATNADGLITAINPNEVTGIVQNLAMLVSNLQGTVNGLSGQVTTLVANLNDTVQNANAQLGPLSNSVQRALYDVTGRLASLERRLSRTLDFGQEALETTFNDPQGGGLHQIRRDIGNLTAVLSSAGPGLLNLITPQIESLFKSLNSSAAKLEGALDAITGMASSPEGGSAANELKRLLSNMVFLTDQLRSSPLFSSYQPVSDN